MERGDFGRLKPSVWNDTVEATGSLAARSRGEPVSSNMLTDDEQELRDRAWRFLVPARSRPWLDRAIAELVATRVLAPDMIEPDPTAYFRGLRETAGRSPVSSYRKLSEDASGDRHLVPGFARVASRVLAADRARLAALATTPGVSVREDGNARARVAENRCLVAWVSAAAGFRARAYRYALDHLFIEAPGHDAVPTERAIEGLVASRRALDALGVPPLAAAACAGEPPRAIERSVISRKG
ncbi:hypothetical protein [Enterovirga rhinocerotis]|uniref:Uncharacterized protein n=1 Tax=Enterovirga rhinocerotis TaxID=1339210 RepID=A0A4R7BY54_9HYPH|nr:hypothetical protein [Enterovirga rhinocerotis]TDR88946.1 hypothetical protein EV668_3431 [Enterovirga rhinocerotis]